MYHRGCVKLYTTCLNILHNGLTVWAYPKSFILIIWIEKGLKLCIFSSPKILKKKKKKKKKLRQGSTAPCNPQEFCTNADKKSLKLFIFSLPNEKFSQPSHRPII